MGDVVTAGLHTGRRSTGVLHPDTLAALLELARTHDLPLGCNISTGLDLDDYRPRVNMLLSGYDDVDALHRWARVLGSPVEVRTDMNDVTRDWYWARGAWLTVTGAVRKP